MVIRWLIGIALCISCPLSASDISAAVDGTQLYPEAPIRGLISISHNQSEKIDDNSFLIGKEPLQVEKIKDVKFSASSPAILTLYRFHLEGKKAGVYELPAITVVVAGQTVTSTPSTYEVAASASPQGAAGASTSPLEHPFLRLEASIDGPSSLYPSQKTRFVYRYFFNASVALTVEQLPLLTAEGVVKIGEKEVRDLQEGGVMAREISQVVEASTPGTYTYGPSLVEGYAYRADAEGNIIERSELLRSEAPPVILTVLPFPDKERPPAFNGAVGEFAFTAELKGDKSVNVGEDISLILKIRADRNVEVVPLPEMCCQPGFVGAFKVSDLPPVETVQGNTKKATILIKPLSSAITEIPPVTFAYFSPLTETYLQLESQTIPIVVHGVIESHTSKLGVVSADQKGPNLAPLPLQEPSPLSKADLFELPLGSHWVLLLLPLGLAFVIYQYYLSRHLKQTQELLNQSSEALLEAAKKESPGSSGYYHSLTLSLKQRLVEVNCIPALETPIAQWPQEGVARRVADWIAHTDELRFSGKETPSAEQVEKGVEALFAQIVTPRQEVKDPPLFLYGPCFLFAILFAWVLWGSSAHRQDPRLQLAAETYHQALEAVEIYPRQTALLDALHQYQILSYEHRPRMGTGRLSEVISTIYAHLGRFPEALWHARWAVSLNPRDPHLAGNIEKMEEALFLEGAPESKWGRFLPTPPQWYQLFAFVVLGAILVSSVAIWTNRSSLPFLFKWSGIACLIVSIPLIYMHYFAPLQGTVLVSSDLRAGPSSSYPRISEQPIPSGSTLELIALVDHGQWLQVYTPKGETGYIPSSAIGFTN